MMLVGLEVSCEPTNTFFFLLPRIKIRGIERILINKIQTQATQESGKKVSFKRISGPQQSGQ